MRLDALLLLSVTLALTTPSIAIAQSSQMPARAEIARRTAEAGRTAEASLKTGDVAEALRAGESAVSADPYSALSYYWRSRAYLAAGQTANAKKDAERAVAIDPSRTDSLRLLGGINLQLKLVPEAVGNFTAAVQKDPKDAAAWYNLALAQETQKNLEKAINAYGKVLEITSNNDLQALNNRGWLYLSTGKTDKAISDFKLVTAKNPRYAKAYLNLGVAYMQNDRKNAIEMLTKAIELEPRSGEAYYLRYQALAAAGRKTDANKDLEMSRRLGYSAKTSTVKPTGMSH